MFFFSAILTEVSKDVFRARILFDFIPENLRNPVAWVMTYLCLNYLGTSVNALSIENGGKFVGATYGFVFIGVFVAFVAFRGFGLVKYARKLEQKRDGKKVDSKETKPRKQETKKDQ